MLHLQCRPSHMIDHRSGCATDAVSPRPQTPTEIYLLLMREKTGIQSTRLLINSGTHEEAGTRRPKQIHRLVILPLILLHDMQHSPTAKGIAIAIHEATSSSGILKLLFLAPSPNLRLHASHIRIGIQGGNRCIQPVRSHLHITVQQHTIRMIHRCDCPIIPLGESVITIKHQRLNRREMGTQQLQGIIGRTIVCHDHLRPIGRMTHHRRKELTHQFTSVPIQYDNRYTLHAFTSCLCFHRRCVQSQPAGSRRIVSSIKRAYRSVM